MQLRIWHKRAAFLEATLTEVVLPEAILVRLTERRNEETDERFASPSIKEVTELMVRLQSRGQQIEGVDTCIVHGDPHCGNVFAILDDAGKMRSVAIIDWGKVKSRCHPATDLCILIADIVFRVRWQFLKSNRKARESWLGRIQNGRHDATEIAFVLAVNLGRMLCWRHPEDKVPWFDQDARARAWAYLNGLLEACDLPFDNRSTE